MYCWITATTLPDLDQGVDSDLLVIWGGTDERECVRVARKAARLHIYAKVVAKAMGGQLLFRAVHPDFVKPMREFREAAMALPPDHPIRIAMLEPG